MVLSKEERCALLEKARAKKKELAEQRKMETAPIVEDIPKKPQEITEKKTKDQKKQKTKKEPRKTLDISNIEDVKKAESEFEIKNEVIRIKAPKKKTIIKRVIEVEEPSSDEEVQEEIVNVPRKKITKKTNTTEEVELPVKNPPVKQTKALPNYFKDIFPS